ncbi:MAG: hypothetical protein M3071_22510 [Actinomycetota bacterium]|nr:hypothetical protein [Actinomycetota bacterium]
MTIATRNAVPRIAIVALREEPPTQLSPKAKGGTRIRPLREPGVPVPARTIGFVAERSPGAGARRDRDVAVALVRSPVVRTIAPEKCDRRAAS